MTPRYVRPLPNNDFKVGDGYYDYSDDDAPDWTDEDEIPVNIFGEENE